MSAALAPQHGMKPPRILSLRAPGMAAAFLGNERGLRTGVQRASAGGGSDARPWRTSAQSRAARHSSSSTARRTSCATIYSQQMLHHGRCDVSRKQALEPGPPRASDSLTRFKLQNFVKEIFVDSDTKVALISGTPTDDAEHAVPEQRPDRRGARRDQPRRRARGVRWATASSTPGAPGWLDEVDRVHRDAASPTAWKGYTIGDPVYQTKKKQRTGGSTTSATSIRSTRRCSKAGLTTICVHKGLMPADYLTSMADLWQYATVWDVGKARATGRRSTSSSTTRRCDRSSSCPTASWRSSKHTGRHRLGLRPRGHSRRVRREQRLRRARHLLRQHLRDASEARAPRMLGTLIRGLGADHVDLGHRLACGAARRSGRSKRCDGIEIPADMQKQHGFTAARCRGRAGEDRDLRRQCRPALWHRLSGKLRRPVRRPDRS